MEKICKKSQVTILSKLNIIYVFDNLMTYLKKKHNIYTLLNIVYIFNCALFISILSQKLYQTKIPGLGADFTQNHRKETPRPHQLLLIGAQSNRSGSILKTSK